MRLAALLALIVATLCAPVARAADPWTLAPPALQWGGAVTVPAPLQIIGYDSVSGNPCIIGYNADCQLLTSVHATGTFDDAAVGLTGDPVTTSASLDGINVAGTMRALTGVNPSGSIYAGQVDIASIAGATVKTGTGTMTGALRVAIASNNDALAVTVASLPLPTGAATAANQAVNNDTAALITMTGQAAGTVNSADQTNLTGRGVQIGVNLTTVTTATVTINIQGKDGASGTYYTILSSTGLATAGFTNLTVYPGAATTTNVSSPQPLPKTWRVQAVVVGASAAVTGTVGASVIN